MEGTSSILPVFKRGSDYEFNFTEKINYFFSSTILRKNCNVYILHILLLLEAYTILNPQDILYYQKIQTTFFYLNPKFVFLFQEIWKQFMIWMRFYL